MSRLRRAIRNFETETGNEPDQDDVTAIYDEQEQDQLIKVLRDENEKNNRLYKAVFTFALIIEIICYFFSPYTLKEPMISFMSITSIISSIWIMNFVPLQNLWRPFDSTNNNNNNNNNNNKNNNNSQYIEPNPLLAYLDSVDGPVAKYLPFLNAFLSLLIALNGYIRHGLYTIYDYLFFAPLASFIVVVGLRNTLGEVDIDSLYALRYKLKGA